MTKIEQLKSELQTMHDLESLTDMLEKTAARTITKMRTNVMSSRPFFREVWRIYGVLKKLTPPSPEVVHKHLIVALGVDWGMQGNLLNRVMDSAEILQKEHDADILIAGKMSHGRFRNKNDSTVYFFPSPKNAVLADIQPIYKIVAGYAKVTIVYPSFESLSKQNVSTASFSIGGDFGIEDSTNKKSDAIKASCFITYPSAQEISNYLSEAMVGLTVYHYFAEAMLAYGAAQMVAMRNGHENATEQGKKVAICYNRAKREQIDMKIRELYNSQIVRGGYM